MLKSKLLDPARPVLLYGTTPPRAGADADAVRTAAAKLAARLAPLPLDGVVVYDIQDESGRTQHARPFAFTGTIDPRAYALLLKQPTIVYKALGSMDEAAWRAWLDETAPRHELVSVVGRPTSGVKHALPLSRAIRIAAERCTVGGVLIAERHTAERSEAARLLAKGIEGCGYFISQTVYHADASIRLLADYARDCRGAGVKPRRIVLTFAPVGREKTMQFLQWLGVRIPDATARAILENASPLRKSIEICRDNLRRILEQPYAREIPLGINVKRLHQPRRDRRERGPVPRAGRSASRRSARGAGPGRPVRAPRLPGFYALLVLAAAALEIFGLQILAPVEDRLLDAFVRTHAIRLAPDPEFVIVDIDERALRACRKSRATGLGARGACRTHRRTRGAASARHRVRCPVHRSRQIPP
jgi:hypothetical protein